jgi:hypothetical protein
MLTFWNGLRWESTAASRPASPFQKPTCPYEKTSCPELGKNILTIFSSLPEAEFLDVMETKMFHLAIHIHLTTKKLFETIL